MQDNKILITTYHEAFLKKGGGEYELLEVAFNLRKLGFIADIYSPFSRDIDFYNTIIHFSTHITGLYLFETLHSYGKKIILWPNVWFQGPVDEIQHSVISRYLELSQAVVFKSQVERALIENVVPLNGIDVLHLPACVDPCFSQPTPTRLFRETFGLKDYILWIGIIEPCKNQLLAITALKHLQIPIVFIGNYREEAYYQACRAQAPDHFLFLDPMPHKSDIFRAAIQECALYIEQTLDPPGKSVLEAAISGANILISQSEWAREHFGNYPVYVDPTNPESIAEGVRIGLEKNRNQELATMLAARHCLPDVLTSLCNYLSDR